MVNFNIKIENRSFILIMILLVVIIFGGFVIAYNPSGTANPAVMGHSYNEIQTCAEGQVLKVVNGNWACSSASGGSLECVTGYYDEIPGTGVGDATYTSGIYPSSKGTTYAFSTVFTTRLDTWGSPPLAATVLICNSANGWILTGCSSADGDTNDEWMLNQNDCRSDYGWWATATARCCKIV